MTVISKEEYYRNSKVAVWQGDAVYPKIPPYHPKISYPDYDIKLVGAEQNSVYEGVRNCFRLIELDIENYGLPDLNPLREFINPGEKVVIKPNFVVNRHSQDGNLYAIITHPSVLRVTVDYVYKALNGDGQIIIADAPQMDCNFQDLLDKTSLASIQEFYWKQYHFPIEIIDLRDFWLDGKLEDSVAYSENRFPLPGDPSGSVLVNLGEKSAFTSHRNIDRIYGADYDRQETIAHHHNGVHRYAISRTILSANVIISVPKMKVHKKVGVTLNSKGLVGITTNKNLLIHYTLGIPEEGGDQFPPHFLTAREKLMINIQRFLYDFLLARQNPKFDRAYDYFVKIYRSLVKPWFGSVSAEKWILDGGNWYGNDSTWRMVVDLMRVAIFADKNGNLTNEPQRKIFSIVDGIIGGDNNGPLVPDEKKAGVIMAGSNPLAVDIVGTRLMDFNWEKLKWIGYLMDDDFFVSSEDIRILSENPDIMSAFQSSDPILGFTPHPGWKGFIECV